VSAGPVADEHADLATCLPGFGEEGPEDVEVVGGARLFGDGPAGSSWSLSGMTRTESGALCLVYDRVRAATGTRLAGA
jgi:hypothetical protein